MEAHTTVEPEITFRNMDASEAVAADVRRRVAWLTRFHPKILACRVAVEAPHRHHRHGKLYRVRVDLSIPGTDVVVGRNPSEHEEHADVYIAVRDAFRAARRALMDELRIRRGHVKDHTRPSASGAPAT